MSNIYVKLVIKKIWGSQNFDFRSLKNSFPGHFLGVPTHAGAFTCVYVKLMNIIAASVCVCEKHGVCACERNEYMCVVCVTGYVCVKWSKWSIGELCQVLLIQTSFPQKICS